MINDGFFSSSYGHVITTVVQDRRANAMSDVFQWVEEVMTAMISYVGQKSNVRNIILKSAGGLREKSKKLVWYSKVEDILIHDSFQSMVLLREK